MKSLLLFLALTACAWSQPTMPFAMWKSAAAPTPTLTVLDSLHRWHDAAQITGKSDGDTLYIWPDLSPTGGHLYQFTGARKPVYRTAQVNGQPAVYFDGVDDFMTGTGIVPYKNSEVTIFVVWRADGAQSDKYLLTFNAASPAILFNYGVANRLSYYDGTHYRIGTYSTDWRIYALVDSASTGISGYENGVHVAYTAGAHTALASGWVAMQIPRNSIERAKMYVAEILIYRTALSSANIASVHAYLKSKYGL